MCSCGCTQYLARDKESILQRVIEIITTLKVREKTADLYEDGECICGMLGTKIPLTQEGEDVWQVVKTVNSFHEELQSEKRKAALNAARDVFSRLPARGNSLTLLTLWQQLERLHREIPDKLIDALTDKEIASAIRVMRHVHDNGPRRREKLIERYNLIQD